MKTREMDDALLEDGTRQFYCRALAALRAAELPFLIGGAYAFAHYTGIVRHTKDIDVFVRERDFTPTLDVLAAMSDCRREVTSPRWLGKAICGDDFVDVIFASGNGLGRVDDLWFKRATRAEILGLPVNLCPPEEMIWSKSFVMERERYDGADIAHLLLTSAPDFDWSHLIWRFGPHWRVLLSQLTLFGYIYPSERDRIPPEVLRALLRRLDAELDAPPSPDRVCQGTLLSIAQYATDIQRWGYEDARTRTLGENLAEYQAKQQRDAAHANGNAQ